MKKSIRITVIALAVALGVMAFGYCDSIASIHLPQNLKTVVGGLLLRCHKLESIVIPDGVTVIENGAFLDCDVLKQVRIPASVTKIEAEAFYECSLLERIDFGGNKAQWDSIVKENRWMDIDAHYTVYCSDGNITK